MKALTYLVISLFTFWLTGCGTSLPSYTYFTPINHPKNAEMEARKAAELQQNTINNYIQQAGLSASPMKEYYTLQAAYLLAEQRQTTEAQNLVNQLNSANYTPENQYLAKLVHINILRQQGQIGLAAQEMQTLQPPASLTLTTQLIAHELRANLYAQQGDTLNSIREHVIMDTLLNNPQGQNQNRQRILSLVKSLPTSTLINAQKHDGSVMDGWLALGVIMHEYEGSPEYPAKLQEWKAAYPNHPALTILNEQAQTQEIKKSKHLANASNLHQVALLLPLTGKLAPNGESIRDGFITANNASGQTINVKVYDTSDTNGDEKNVLKSYKQAVDEGADLIIGPLTKGGVTQINSIKRLSVPVLTLNYIQAPNHHDSELYEFGLAPEDEARQAARFALQNGQHRALILVQADEWGGRVSRAFTEEWYRMGGQTPIKVVFSANDNMNHVVRQALKIQLSAAQKERLTSQPKRRQDIDMIFLGTQANAARQIKPLLDFYYANDLPVYGTSSIYALPPNTSLDRDLNGVYVCDMPWLLSPQTAEPRLHSTINELWPSSANTYARFFALGIDAFNLSSHLSELKVHPLPGVTGDLYLATDGRIERKVKCTQFHNGKPQL